MSDNSIKKFDEFDAWLNKNKNNELINFSNFLECDLDKLNKEDLEKVSEVLEYIEWNNLFYMSSYINDDKKFYTYKKIFEFIALEFIDYTTFFSDLDNKNLNNLKEACFDLLKKSNGLILEEIFIKELKKENRKFRNDYYITLEIINSLLPTDKEQITKNQEEILIKKEVIKKYLDYNETILDPNHILNEDIKQYYLSKYGDYGKKSKYKITMRY